MAKTIQELVNVITESESKEAAAPLEKEVPTRLDVVQANNVAVALEKVAASPKKIWPWVLGALTTGAATGTGAGILSEKKKTKKQTTSAFRQGVRRGAEVTTPRELTVMKSMAQRAYLMGLQTRATKK
jgi:hypothetical protein